MTVYRFRFEWLGMVLAGALSRNLAVLAFGKVGHINLDGEAPTL